MPIRVRLRDVAQPQDLRVDATRSGGNPASDADRRALIVHTGWIGATFVSDELAREEVISFVPLDNGEIQRFELGNQDLGNVTAVVTASLSSFADEPNTAAVDNATVRLEPRTFPGIEGSPQVLILRARVTVAGGKIHGISYQVTVRAHPSLLVETLDLPDSTQP